MGEHAEMAIASDELPPCDCCGWECIGAGYDDSDVTCRDCGGECFAVTDIYPRDCDCAPVSCAER